MRDVGIITFSTPRGWNGVLEAGGRDVKRASWGLDKHRRMLRSKQLSEIKHAFSCFETLLCIL